MSPARGRAMDLPDFATAAGSASAAISSDSWVITGMMVFRISAIKAHHCVSTVA